ncbi:glycoside hydrolase family 16 protein [Candidatus Xianfuyuplasma coldseepsis]|uniref:Glycoside hydrolase family 16 protein n=1 Tax=Candidatus Xianfuyuplasma coldseepsis TaxID=2782163 RepID=A0A7L7KNZ4_9MOLU|nr:glycoside hydrolase family 16 protein [Xianfuyuplasma coldseepsis]QMS84423.1 glycoside hydrolase family 16 protein [Xianfuyuplasma coldseepsis]
MKLIKEYDFTSMTTLDKDWNVRVGDKWANRELQHYVNDKEHILFQDGLVLKATYDGTTIRSARMDTKDNFYFTYGLIEIDAKLPGGKGTWPAIWMMPNEKIYGHWPKSGEIDIVEYAANKKDRLFFCLHTEKYNHRKPDDQYYTDDIFPNIADDFHTFALKWEESQITYYVDGEVVAHYKRGEHGKDPGPSGWPFTHDYYLILNLAIGGTFGGAVDYTMFPQEMVVKAIRVYQ